MIPFQRCITRETISMFKQLSRSCYQTHQVIRVGDSLPQVDLYEDFPTNTVKMPDTLMGRKVVMFGVPGAFSPGCSSTHLPGFLETAHEMRKDGVDEIMCVSVNDPYVMGAWAAHNNTRGKIRMLADPTGAFVYSLGLGMHCMPLGGFRSQRFSMFIDDNKIKEINIEPDGTGLTCSLAKRLVYKKHLKTRGELT